MNLNKQFLDDTWQDIYDEKRLQAAREQKNAYMHLFNLVNKYAEDLRAAQEELGTIQNTDNVIIKDYDIETKVDQ